MEKQEFQHLMNMIDDLEEIAKKNSLDPKFIINLIQLRYLLIRHYYPEQ